MIKRSGMAAGLLLVLGAIVAGRWIVPAFDLATGYSAKQLCSGVFRSGLPADYIIENDIHLSMAALGPLWPLLHTEVDVPATRVRASLLGSSAVAVYTAPTMGCVLNPPDEAALPGYRPFDYEIIYEPDDPVMPSAAMAAVIDQAFLEPVSGQRHTQAVIVMHRGEIIAERYAAPVHGATPLQGWSMNKSLMATWVGMQVSEGALALTDSVRDAVHRVDPDLAGNIDPALNLGHLLHMESGFDFEETYLPGDDATQMLYRSPAMWRVAPGTGQRHAPGEHFNYSSGDTNLAAWLWTHSLQGEAYIRWIGSNFSGPLGLSPYAHERDASGIQVGSSYSYMTAIGWARVGRFWLDAYHGRSELLSQEWMQASVTPRPANTHGNYGRGFWLNTQAYDFPELPRKLFYASGHNGQYVAVFPDQELVVVRLGLASSFELNGVAELLQGVLANLPGPD
ncbi:MAG: serine hydrolase [Halieaceae bacterium]